jgi:CheY-like chemotaxis protein
LTANSSLSEKEKCINMGMNEYLSKPFKCENLISTILKHVREKKPRSVEVKSNRGKFKFKKEYDNASIINRKEQSIPHEKIISKPYRNLSHYQRKNDIYLKTHKYVNLDSLNDYCDGDEDCQKALIVQYLKDFPGYINTLKQAIQMKNFPEIKNISHKMKSSVTLFGMTEARDMLEMIEKYAQANDIKCIMNVFNDCIISLEESIEYLSIYNDS